LLKNGAPRGVSRTDTLAESVVATGFPPVRDQAPANNFDSFMSVKRGARAVRRWRLGSDRSLLRGRRHVRRLLGAQVAPVGLGRRRGGSCSLEAAA
jgi:hypothetical protein